TFGALDPVVISGGGFLDPAVHRRQQGQETPRHVLLVAAGFVVEGEQRVADRDLPSGGQRLERRRSPLRRRGHKISQFRPLAADSAVGLGAGGAKIVV